jgi:hypothetical protein
VSVSEFDVFSDLDVFFSSGPAFSAAGSDFSIPLLMSEAVSSSGLRLSVTESLIWWTGFSATSLS